MPAPFSFIPGNPETGIATALPSLRPASARRAGRVANVHLPAQPKTGITGRHFNNGKEVIQCLIVANRGRA